jgi:hypothetical protein
LIITLHLEIIDAQGTSRGERKILSSLVRVAHLSGEEHEEQSEVRKRTCVVETKKKTSTQSVKRESPAEGHGCVCERASEIQRKDYEME